MRELWDLLRVLNTDAEFVLGREMFGHWGNMERALPLVKGEENPTDEREVWQWICNPLPPRSEHALFANLRIQLGISDESFFTDKGFGSLGYLEQQGLAEGLAPGFFRDQNPVVRHTVLRRRRTLEDAGLLERVGVNVHPDPDAGPETYRGVNFEGLGLVTNHPFDLAYEAAESFTKALRQRSKAAGFMKTLLLQRICSSFASGRSTAEKLRRREPLDDEEGQGQIEDILEQMTAEEARHLDTIIDELSRPEVRDPKTEAVTYFLTEHRSESKAWLKHGCIIFSQYYDTVWALAAELTAALQGEAVAIYAGAGRSGIHRDGDFASVEREEIKAAIRRHEIRLLVATDAACEGLNLQTLGTMINVDLPWNPSRLEQRLGRIKRFGQRRHNVDMLNLGLPRHSGREGLHRTLATHEGSIRHLRQPPRHYRRRVDRGRREARRNDGSVHPPTEAGPGRIRDSVRAACRSRRRAVGTVFACTRSTRHCREAVEPLVKHGLSNGVGNSRRGGERVAAQAEESMAPAAREAVALRLQDSAPGRPNITLDTAPSSVERPS